MKTFSKKLISLMLVALMLVAAMPMAAFADEVDGSEEYQDLVVNKDVNVEVTVEDEDGQNVDIKSGTLANFPMDFDKKSDSTKKDWVKKALTAVGLKASNYTYDASSGGYYDADSLFAVTVKIANHTHKLEIVDKDDPEYEDDAEYHVLRCTICGQETKEIHKWTVVKDSGKGEPSGHLVKCAKCGYESDFAKKQKSGELERRKNMDHRWLICRLNRQRLFCGLRLLLQAQTERNSL